MLIPQQQNLKGSGPVFAESISVSEDSVNLLFLALLATAVGVFGGGNVLLRDASMVAASAPIFTVCVMQIVVFYSLARLTGSLPTGLALTYLLMCLTTYCHVQWVVWAMYVVGAAALTYTLVHLRIVRKDLWLVLFMAFVATITILGCTDAYTSFDMIPRLVEGRVNKDTLYNASIAAMIKNYGVVSTGLHGLVKTPYHVLSHVLYAALSTLSGRGVFEVYGVATWVLFAPILIFCVSCCTVMLDRSERQVLPLVWGAVCAVLVLAPFFFKRWGVWDSFFVSESYLVSLGLFMITLPFLFKQDLDWRDLGPLLLMSLMLPNAKATVSIFFVGLWFSRVALFYNKVDRRERISFLLAAGAVFVMLYSSAAANSGNSGFAAFDFIRQYSAMGRSVTAVADTLGRGEMPGFRSGIEASVAILAFMLAHFSFSWVILGVVLVKRDNSFLRGPYAVYVLASLFAGMAIISLFAIAGGSAYYFSNIAFFVALPGVVAMLVRSFEKGGGARIPVTLVLLSMVLLKFTDIAHAAQQQQNTRRWHHPFVDLLLDIRGKARPLAIVVVNPQMLPYNPIADCTAQPFVYPAVSEHAWVNVIVNCGGPKYQYYSYSQYGITDSEQDISIPPVLPNGAEILTLQ